MRTHAPPGALVQNRPLPIRLSQRRLNPALCFGLRSAGCTCLRAYVSTCLRAHVPTSQVIAREGRHRHGGSSDTCVTCVYGATSKQEGVWNITHATPPAA